MSFGATIEDTTTRNTNPNFRRTEFISMGAGSHRIRILDEQEVKKFAHRIGWTWVECLGDSCPMCDNNRRILYEHPKDYKNARGWCPKQTRYFVNVLDKTPTKVCPKCFTERQDESTNCPNCDSPLGEATPLNKVKVLSRGKTLFEDIAVIANSIRDEQDEVVDIRTYDWLLIVRGSGLETVVTPSPKWVPGKEDFEDLKGQELFNLDKAIFQLAPDEMLDLFNGGTLKDIFAMRRAKNEVLKSPELIQSEQIGEDIDKAVENIFKA